MLSNEDAVRAFAAGRSGNSKNVFHDDHGRLYSYGHHFILAVRLNGNYLINGDTYSPSTSRHTSLCIEHLKPNVIIPFSALDRVTRDYHLIEIVDRDSDKYIQRTRKDPETGELIKYEEHRLGAAVIKFENKYYLSSIDDGARERRGYFLVELPERARDVENAFDLLFPEEMDQRCPYVRQGEFFFVPTDMETSDLSPMETLYEWGLYDYHLQHANNIKVATKEMAEELLKKHVKTWGPIEDVSGRMVLHRFPIEDPHNLTRYFPDAGTGHAHTVTEIRRWGSFQPDRGNMNNIFVRGTVRHPEHKMLKLGKIWHRVYVNRAVKSFSASGDVD
jgi:hypothetical protein